MKRNLYLVLAIVVGCAPQQDQHISRPRRFIADEIAYDAVMQMEEGEVLSGKIDIGRDVLLPFRFSITSKGNGGLQIGGLGIRTYDAHADGLVFEGFLLHHRFVDVDSDGYKDLVLSGMALITDESGSSRLMRRPIVSIFLYDPKKGRLRNTVPDDAVYTWELPGAVQEVIPAGG